MRYDAHSGIAVLHGVGILEKGNQMAELTSYIVEIGDWNSGRFPLRMIISQG